MRRALKKTTAKSEKNVGKTEKIKIAKTSFSDSSVEYRCKSKASPFERESSEAVLRFNECANAYIPNVFKDARSGNTVSNSDRVRLVEAIIVPSNDIISTIPSTRTFSKIVDPKVGSNSGNEETIHNYTLDHLLPSRGNDIERAFSKCCKWCENISPTTWNSLLFADRSKSKITECNTLPRNSSFSQKKKEDFSMGEVKKVIGIIYKYDGAKRKTLPAPSEKCQVPQGPHVLALERRARARPVSCASLPQSLLATEASANRRSRMRAASDGKVSAHSCFLQMAQQRKRIQLIAHSPGGTLTKKNKIPHPKSKSIGTRVSKGGAQKACLKSGLDACNNKQMVSKGWDNCNKDAPKTKGNKVSFEEIRDIKHNSKKKNRNFPSVYKSSSFFTSNVSVLPTKASKKKGAVAETEEEEGAAPGRLWRRGSGAASTARTAVSIAPRALPPSSCRSTLGSPPPSSVGSHPRSAPTQQGLVEANRSPVRQQPSTEMVHRWIDQTAASLAPRISAKCCSRKWVQSSIHKQTDLKLEPTLKLEKTRKPLRR